MPVSAVPVPPGAATLRLRDRTFDASSPAVMAIINRTSDSFFEGNRHDSLGSALEALGRAVEDGADIIDVGGVRAGEDGDWISTQEEIDRVGPFLEAARDAFPEAVLSLDTWRSAVCHALSHIGIDLVNDAWAGHDPALTDVAARIGAALVCSHAGGLPPRTDPVSVTYPPEPTGVVEDVLDTLTTLADRARSSGIPRDRILLDPTLDFGKTTDHSLTLVRHTADVVALGYPVMQAVSRKKFIGEVLELAAPERLEGSLAATAVSAWLGIAVFRTHDVRATRRTLDLVSAIRGDASPGIRVRGVPPS